MRHILSQSILFALLILTSCSDSKEKKEQSNNKTQTENLYANNSRTFEFLEDHCGENDCSRVIIDYPEFAGSTDFVQDLNKQLQSTIQQTLSNYVMKGANDMSIEELSKKFIQGYNEFKAQFPEVKSKWYVNINCEITYQNRDFISLAITTQSYTGGAHQNTEVTYSNYSSYAELVNDLDFFFFSKEQLIVAAEKEFRKLKNIGQEKSLADAGFIFDNNMFSLSEEFGFNNSGLILYYNNYEIASYAEGYSKLIVPFDVLDSNYRFSN